MQVTETMTHEFDGKKYEKASAHQRQWGTRLIAELNLRGSERVLDLGCGDGTLTAQIAALLPKGKALGIDASQGMIDTARPKERDNLRFLLMDIDDLDFVAQFDVVFSNAALHWVRDHRRLWHNVCRALRPGGRVRFNFAAQGNCRHLFKVIRQAMALPEFAAHFADFEWPWYMPPVDRYAALVQSTGLKDTRVWPENRDTTFPNVDALTAWIDQPSLVPFLAHLPSDARTPFRNFVVARMIEETARDDGTCFETFRRINVAASKPDTDT